MKRTDLERLLQKSGWWILRDKGPHTVWTNGKETEPIPRHKEIRERLAQAIIKRRGLK